jgi:hypothetical protein
MKERNWDNTQKGPMMPNARQMNSKWPHANPDSKRQRIKRGDAYRSDFK